LQEFETGAAAQHEDVFRGGEVLAERGAEEFIDGVVASDVFAREDERAVEIDECGAVRAAGFGEEGLGGAKGFGEARELLGRKREGGRRRRGGKGGGGQSFERDAAAEAAGGAGEKAATDALEIFARRVAELDALGGDGFAADVFGVRGVGKNVVGPGNQAFGEEESEREVGVVAGGAHRDGEDLAELVSGTWIRDLDGERVFDDEGFVGVEPAAFVGPVQAGGVLDGRFAKRTRRGSGGSGHGRGAPGEEGTRGARTFIRGSGEAKQKGGVGEGANGGGNREGTRRGSRSLEDGAVDRDLMAGESGVSPDRAEVGAARSSRQIGASCA